MAVYRLANSAREDIINLLAYTQENFGEAARLRYEKLLITALHDIASDPDRVGSIARPELGGNIHSYHLRHSRERAKTEQGMVVRPRHFLLYRVVVPNLIGVGRVLHDAMQLERHLPSDYGDG